MNENETTFDERADRAGLLLSVICCIHCMAIPALIVFAPSIASIFENPLVHTLSIFIIVPVGLYAFLKNIKLHSDRRPLIIGVIGMLVILIGHFNHTLFHDHQGVTISHASINTFELVASVIGGLALVFAHALNIKLCRCKKCEH